MTFATFHSPGATRFRRRVVVVAAAAAACGRSAAPLSASDRDASVAGDSGAVDASDRGVSVRSDASPGDRSNRTLAARSGAGASACECSGDAAASSAASRSAKAAASDRGDGAAGAAADGADGTAAPSPRAGDAAECSEISSSLLVDAASMCSSICSNSMASDRQGSPTRRARWRPSPAGGLNERWATRLAAPGSALQTAPPARRAGGTRPRTGAGAHTRRGGDSRPRGTRGAL